MEARELYTTYCPKNWEDIVKKLEELDGNEKATWVFRGDKPCPANGGLEVEFKSTLDRAFIEFGIPEGKRNKIETGLIREFRRKASLYHEQRLERWLDCLALMRHHGAPTRLLDWTYSFYTSLYFAANNANKKCNKCNEICNKKCIVWALDSRKIKEWNSGANGDSRDLNGEVITEKTKKIKDPSEKNRKREELEKLREEFPNIFASDVVHYLITKNPRCLIYVANPYFMNERLSIQRGILICQGNSGKTWGENLEEMLRKMRDGKVLVKIDVDFSKIKREEILKRLFDMNISHASLFPDLDGFAQSLWTRIACPETIGADCQ